jgi:hypothetical protein
MLERLNPVLRLVCIALVGVILYQVSRIFLRGDAMAHSRMEAPVARIEPKKEANIETNAPAAKTNSTSVATNAPVTPAKMPPGANRRIGAQPPSNLPADVQALVDKIKQSQLLGPDIKPPPMALLGIAGKDVFLRGPNGQTEIIREGEELGGAKLIRVGTNRVVVEHEGQQKELTIFSGFGSETLLEKKDKSEPLH